MKGVPQMTPNPRWLLLPVLLLALGAASVLAAHGQAAPAAHVTQLAQPTISAKLEAGAALPAALAQRVEDPTSPAYRAWLAELSQQNLELDAVLTALNGDLTATQKNALLKSYLRSLPAGAELPQPEKWRAFLSSSALSAELDSALALTVGRMLGNIATDSDLKNLEDVFSELGSDLPNGNRLAVVAASKNRAFVNAVLNDTEQTLELRDQAVERAAALGSVDSLHQIASPDSKADVTLKVSALRGLATVAENQGELADVLHLAEFDPEPDAYGRKAVNVASVGVAEATVIGKAGILFNAWAEAVQAARGQTSADALGRGLVLGKSLARAFWTDDPHAVETLIEGGLAPLVARVLEVEAKAGNWQAVQLVAEFASDLKFECRMRPTSPCTEQAEARARFRDALALAVIPVISGTELGFYELQLKS